MRVDHPNNRPIVVVVVTVASPREPRPFEHPLDLSANLVGRVNGTATVTIMIARFVGCRLFRFAFAAAPCVSRRHQNVIV